MKRKSITLFTVASMLKFTLPGKVMIGGSTESEFTVITLLFGSEAERKCKK